MDQLYVPSPVRATGSTPLERAFFSEFPLLANYIGRLVGSLDDAPAIACEAFRRVAGRTPVLEQSLRVELYTVATELSRKVRRPRRWFRRTRMAPVELEDFPPPDARRAFRRDTVQRALAALPFEGRAIVLLRDLVKFSYEELELILGIPPRKLVHALDRGRAELTEIYAYIKF